MIAVPPRLGEFLTRTAQTPDLESALWKILSEYVDMKIEVLNDKINQFEQKWGMSFVEFQRNCQDGTLDKDSYSWDVEQNYWEWEQAVTLLDHYQSLGN